jgi:predicted dehydrogenase
MEGMSATNPSFGAEDPTLYGTLTTLTELDRRSQTFDPKSKKYIGNYPTVPGRWRGFYENLADAVRGRAEIAVKAEDSRDGLRVMELARKSHETGTTLPWS